MGYSVIDAHFVMERSRTNMKILAKEKGSIKVKAENINDLWCLNNIIAQGDLVKGQTFRKIKIGDSGDRSMRVVKKKVFLALRIEKVEFHDTTTTLRVSGTVEEGPEDIPRGSYHTFNVGENTIIKIVKERFSRYHLEKLNQATKYKGPKVLICVMDRETSVFALLKGEVYEVLSKLNGNVQKKAQDDSPKSDFYYQILKVLEEYDGRYKLDSIVVASPAFWKEDFFKVVKNDEIKKKIYLASCSSSSETAINEVLKRTEVQKLIKDDFIAKDILFMEKLLDEIAKEGLAVYGFKETKVAIDAGAVEVLLLTDKKIHDAQLKKSYDLLETLMKSTEDMKGKINIISSSNDAGKKLDGLGGIGAILRYKLSY